MAEKKKENQKLARKIQGWLPDDNLSWIACKLRFLGSSFENSEGMDGEECFGAGKIISELSRELQTTSDGYCIFSINLTELATGRDLSSIRDKPETRATQ